MHEGGELGYSMVHAFGAAFDNPDLIVACIIGDGESETCPLEGSWKSVNFLNPVRDGAVLPILHLNGYKISGPTVQGRTSDEDLRALYIGRGYKPYFVEGDDPEIVHQLVAKTLDDCYADIRTIQQEARQSGFNKQPIWPMIVLRTPKGWTCPKEVDGIPIEGTFRAHQVPLATVRENPEHLKILEAWMRSYKPEELFDRKGRFIAELAELAPIGDEGDSHLSDLIEDRTVVSPAEAVINANLKEQTKHVLHTLNPREEKVLKMRFGLEDGLEHTLEEVGLEFAVTRERIRQIEAKALRKLRRPSRSRKLMLLLDGAHGCDPFQQ